ncbi:2-phospho-L-lactate guanylyltransferase [Spongiibacter sp.]|uniref:2-phospho-L-lactate guanylyltransferase n=1 Tax=Spongiibacter sp. TaxID=2024860 RepID=UPI003562E75E
MWLVLPLKDFVQAKQRLSGCLSVSERRTLFQHMVEDVLAVLSSVPACERLLIVSDDPAAHLLAEHFGAECWPEAELGRGLNAVLEATLARIASLPSAPQNVMIVHGDLPLINAAELSALVARQAEAAVPAMVIATDRHRRGSNVLLMPLRQRISLHYGEHSLAAHRRAAQRAGLELLVQCSEGLASDIDTRDDLLALVERAADDSAGQHLAPQTMSYLQGSGIARRLQQMNPPADQRSEELRGNGPN